MTQRLILSISHVLLLLWFNIAVNRRQNVIILPLLHLLLPSLYRVIDGLLHISLTLLGVKLLLGFFLLVNADEAHIIQCLIEFYFFVVIIVSLLVALLECLVNDRGDS